MYVNVFRSRKRADYDAEAYAAVAARMLELAQAQPGFISFKSFTAPDGEGLSISEWASEADAKAWGRHAEHAAVQARGRAAVYASYTMYDVVDPRVKRFEADQ